MIKYIKKAIKKWLLRKAQNIAYKFLIKIGQSGVLSKYTGILKSKIYREDKRSRGFSEYSTHNKSQGGFTEQSPSYNSEESIKSRGHWQPPETARPYLNSIEQVEQRHNMPQNLLARLIYQESRYRQDIITGKTVSSAGAIGIAQIVPRWHPDVNPLNPEESIHYSGKYLNHLQRQFGDWPTALAAYNWGPGNVSKAQKRHGKNWLDKAPTETRNYVHQIMRDVV